MNDTEFTAAIEEEWEKTCEDYELPEEMDFISKKKSERKVVEKTQKSKKFSREKEGTESVTERS